MPPRILLADDNPLVRSALRQVLEKLQPCEILEASDGQEAVEKALESRPTLAILDLAMPRLDGLHASLKICQALPDTPIVLCTMHWSRHLEVEALKFGIRKTISKSESGALVAAVQELLSSTPPLPPPPAESALPAVPVPIEPVAPNAPAPVVDPAPTPPASDSVTPAPPTDTLPPDPNAS